MIPDWAGYCGFRDAFAGVMDERYYTLDWLDQQILLGKVQFFCTDDAAIIAEIKDYPTGAKDVHGLIAAGDLADIIEVLIPQAEAWGKERGCIAGLIESRPGWAKTLKGFGYEPHQLTIRKELTDGPIK